MVELKNLSVKMQLVADVKKTGAGARVVPSKPEPIKPRVDVQTEVETYDAKPGTANGNRAVGISGSNGSVKVGAGGGVLGHLLATKSGKTAAPDATNMSASELRALLAPFVGQEVVVSNYDRDESATLAIAAKKGDVADARGTLVGVDDKGCVQLKKDGRVNEVNPAYWAMARIRVDGGEVIAQDPTYPRHYSE